MDELQRRGTLQDEGDLLYYTYAHLYTDICIQYPVVNNTYATIISSAMQWRHRDVLTRTNNIELRNQEYDVTQISDRVLLIDSKEDITRMINM